MLTTAIQLGRILPRVETQWRILPRHWNASALTLGLALGAVPVSIAIAESLLVAALLFRLHAIAHHTAHFRLPRIFWVWLPWAVLEVAAWLHSPDIKAGFGELRHLLLVAALFIVLPALDQPGYAVTIWRGIFLSSTLSSLVLIGDFISRRVRFSDEISNAADPSFFLRSGGVLWICCVLLLILHLAWKPPKKRSKWIWAVPVYPVIFFALAPGPLRFRATAALNPSYYSTVERVEMLQVGARMIASEPLTGLGPGRVEALYRRYLSPAEPVPAYHGHLHNNLFQLAAQFGLPVAGAAMLFVVVLFKRLKERWRPAADRESQFICRTAILSVIGFLAAGMFDYTYGHSLGLILVSFVAIAPFEENGSAPFQPRDLLDRIGGACLFVSSLLLILPAAIAVRVLSGRSPFIAHLRIGRHGRTFWVWKLRTMWTREQPVAEETGWVQRVECDPPQDLKPRIDPRICSRFAQFCRRHSIDELPQFLHVMRGQMSLVGPRPVTRGELMQHYGARSREILSLKPGLTGYWQTRGRSSLSYAERVALDLQLVRELSTRVYLELLFRTIPELLRGKNAW